MFRLILASCHDSLIYLFGQTGLIVPDWQTPRPPTKELVLTSSIFDRQKLMTMN